MSFYQSNDYVSCPNSVTCGLLTPTTKLGKTALAVAVASLLAFVIALIIYLIFKLFGGGAAFTPNKDYIYKIIGDTENFTNKEQYRSGRGYGRGPGRFSRVRRGRLPGWRNTPLHWSTNMGGYGPYYGYGWGLPYGVDVVSEPTILWDKSVLLANNDGCFSRLPAGLHLYYSNNCPACTKIKPLWQSIDREFRDNINLFTIDVNTEFNPCVKTIPTIIASNNGVSQKYDGDMNFNALSKWIKTIYNL